MKYPDKKSLRTFFMVVILSCLIWLYADQITTEFITEFVKISVKPAQGSNLIVKLAEPTDGLVEVTFAGPRVQLEKLRNDIKAGKFKPVYYVKSVGNEQSEFFRDIEDVIRDYLVREYTAITVKSVTPQQIKIKVDQYIRVKMPVRILTGTVEVYELGVSPDSVEVKLPLSLYKSIPLEQRFVPVDIESELIGKVGQDEFVGEVAVPQKIMGWPVEISPDRVGIKLKIKHRYVRREIKRPIHILSPVDIEHKYIIELRDKDITIPIVGPKARIKAIKPEKIIPYIEIFPDDVVNLRDTYFPRRLKFILPEGIKIDESKMPLSPEVEFKIREKVGLNR